MQLKTCTTCGETKSSKGFNYLTCGDCRKKKYRKSKNLPDWEERTPGDGNSQMRKTENKVCRSCMKEHPEESFHIDAPILLVSSFCANCRREKHEAKPQAYSLSRENRLLLIAHFGGVCQICRKPEKILGHELSIDHCHETGRIRGVLCRIHNSAIGWLNTPELLDAAKEYLLVRPD